jgi:hypothetical protein
LEAKDYEEGLVKKADQKANRAHIRGEAVEHAVALSQERGMNNGKGYAYEYIKRLMDWSEI